MSTTGIDLFFYSSIFDLSLESKGLSRVYFLCKQLAYTITCFDPNAVDGITLEDRLFRTENYFDADLLDKYIDVTFTSAPGDLIIQ